MNPQIKIISVSAKTGEGLSERYDWLRTKSAVIRSTAGGDWDARKALGRMQ